jgi:hypothetical protein
MNIKTYSKSDIRKGVIIDYKHLTFYLCFTPISFYGGNKIRRPEFYIRSCNSTNSIELTVSITKRKGFRLSIGVNGIYLNSLVFKLQWKWWDFGLSVKNKLKRVLRFLKLQKIKVNVKLWTSYYLIKHSLKGY